MHADADVRSSSRSPCRQPATPNPASRSAHLDEDSRSRCCCPFANPQRVSLAMEVCERVAVELAPGSVVFFHCNTLHCSAPNHSDDPRWALICCYNALSNTVAPPAPGSAISPWDDGCVLEYGREQLREEEVQQARI